MAAVFLSNAMLTQWSDQGKVRLEDTTLHLIQEKRTVSLKPAVRFTKVIDDAADPHALLNKVKTTEQLAEIGAEHYLDSVILGDTGYTVIEGFLGDLSPPPRKAKAAAPPPAAGAAPAPVEVTPPVGSSVPAASPLEREAEELSKLFLDTVKD